jgi:hypothetical protein
MKRDLATIEREIDALRHELETMVRSSVPIEGYQEDGTVLQVQTALEAMIKLFGGERVAKWVRDLTFLIERKELP